MKTRKIKNADSLHIRLGISQHLLAGYLGIGRSSITMSEGCHRLLPFKGLMRMGPMERILDTLDSYPTPESMQHSANKDANMLKQHLEKVVGNCNVKLMRWNIQLQQMREEHAKAKDALKLSGIMLAQLPDEDTKDTKRQKVFLRLMESGAVLRITKYGEAAQVKLQLQMEVVAFELEAARKLLEG